MWRELVDRVLQHSEIPRQPLFSRQTELPRNLIDTETGKLSRVIADLVATQVGQNVVSETGLLAQQPTTSTSLTKIGHVVLESAGVSPSRLQTITWEILASASATVPTVPDALPVPVVSEPLSHPVSEPVSPHPCMPLPYNWPFSWPYGNVDSNGDPNFQVGTKAGPDHHPSTARRRVVKCRQKKGRGHRTWVYFSPALFSYEQTKQLC
jgi:hypothetical protein